MRNILNSQWAYTYSRAKMTTVIDYILDDPKTKHTLYLKTNISSNYESLDKDSIANVHEQINKTRK